MRGGPIRNDSKGRDSAYPLARIMRLALPLFLSALALGGCVATPSSVEGQGQTWSSWRNFAGIGVNYRFRLLGRNGSGGYVWDFQFRDVVQRSFEYDTCVGIRVQDPSEPLKETWDRSQSDSPDNAERYWQESDFVWFVLDQDLDATVRLSTSTHIGREGYKLISAPSSPRPMVFSDACP